MPELVNSSVGSLPGTSGLEGHDRVAFALEVSEELIADFAAFHGGTYRDARGCRRAGKA